MKKFIIALFLVFLYFAIQIASAHTEKQSPYYRLMRDNGISIESKSIQVEVEILIDIFTHKRNTWIDGTRVTTIDFEADSMTYKDFVRSTLMMTTYYFEDKRKHALYREMDKTSIFVRREDEVYQKLLTQRNVIAYTSDGIYYKDNIRIWRVEVLY